MDRHFNTIKDRFVRASLKFENDCVCTKKRKKGEKYTEYEKAISPHIDNLREQILNSPTGYISVRLSDIKKLMGPEFEKRLDRSSYQILKHILFERGIVTSIIKDEYGNVFLIMRFATTGDTMYV
jgi:hypothetical protein